MYFLKNFRGVIFGYNGYNFNKVNKINTFRAFLVVTIWLQLVTISIKSIKSILLLVTKIFPTRENGLLMFLKKISIPPFLDYIKI